MNKIYVEGTLGKDPVFKIVQTADGEKPVTEFSIATNQREKKNGEWIDGLTVWYKVSAWGALAEIAIDQLFKGTKVNISGTFKVVEYTAKDGTIKQSFEIKASTAGDISLPLQKAKQPANELNW